MITYMYLPHAGQNMLDMIQDKVVTVQDLVDTFQNTTEASTGKHHHEVVELLQNISCSLDSKTLPHFQAPTLQSNMGIFINCTSHRPDVQFREVTSEGKLCLVTIPNIPNHMEKFSVQTDISVLEV